MTERRDLNLLGPWTLSIVMVVILAAAGVIIVVSREAGRDRKPAALQDEFKYDVDRYKVIPEEHIGYEQIGELPTGFKKATAVAVGWEDYIIVAGDQQVHCYSSVFHPLFKLDVGARPVALASLGEDIFVATKDRVGLLPDDAEIRWLLKIPGKKPRITSIAADETYLHVADAGSRGVWRYTLDGQPRGRVGDKDQDREIPGFAVPSPYFDVFAAPDGLLRVVDPGRHKVTAFTGNGDLELSWGTPTFALHGFSGCCNPSHIAMLPDGSYVTSEKGIPRVKVYDPAGEFVTAVVGMEGLATETAPCDVAADRKGRILVLDPGSNSLRLFRAIGKADRDD